MGSVSTAASGKLVLVLPNNGGEIVLFGPDNFPTAPILVLMPVLLARQNGTTLKVVTIGPDGAVLKTGCLTCVSPTFDLLVGGSAGNSTLVEEAKGAPPATEAATDPKDIIFFFRVRGENNLPLNETELSTAITSINTTDIDPATALTLLQTLGEVLPSTASESGSDAPTVEETAKIEALMEVVLSANNENNIEHVFVKDESESLIQMLTRFLLRFGLRSSSKKFDIQLTTAEEQANVIPKLLEQLRQVSAQTEAARGTIDRSNVCSEVVTDAAGGTFCNGAAFPHVVDLIGAGLPADSTRRVTAVAMNLAEMDRSDQSLTNSLDLTSAVSPHFSAIITPLVSDPAAHQLRSTFDSAKGNDFAAAADNTFNCYQRIATNNNDPSGTYNQLTAAGQQDRPTGTAIRCVGENSGRIRWVTLAKPVAVVNPGNNNPTGTTSGSSTITPVTPTAPTARAVVADSDDGSSSSGIIGGVIAGGGLLLIFLALVVCVLFRRQKAPSQEFATEEVYQTDGFYKVPAPTPV